MQPAVPPIPGEIYRHGRFYRDDEGIWQPKFLLVLAFSPGRDIVYRLLTSEPHGRSTTPPCHHGDPYPGYFLDVPGGPLTRQTWLDLRAADDYDDGHFAEHVSEGWLQLALSLPLAQVCEALSCAARAEDTTNQQARAMLDQRAIMGCP